MRHFATYGKRISRKYPGLYDVDHLLLIEQVAKIVIGRHFCSGCRIILAKEAHHNPIFFTNRSQMEPI